MSASEGGPGWDDIAEWYDRLVESGSGPHETAVECLLRLVPPLDGARVVDVACGQGLATRALAGAGAAGVLGVDASPAMIDLARRRTRGRGHGGTVSYVQDDAGRLATCLDDAFDGAACQLGLMDVPDLDATLAAVHRVLKPGGWFVFVVGHPCFLVPEARAVPGPDGRAAVQVTGYFHERFWRSAKPNGVRRAGNHHRTLSTYLNGLVRCGFRLEAVEEPPASARLAAEQPLYTEVPIFFAARARAE